MGQEIGQTDEGRNVEDLLEAAVSGHRQQYGELVTLGRFGGNIDTEGVVGVPGRAIVHGDGRIAGRGVGDVHVGVGHQSQARFHTGSVHGDAVVGQLKDDLAVLTRIQNAVAIGIQLDVRLYQVGGQRQGHHVHGRHRIDAAGAEEVVLAGRV